VRGGTGYSIPTLPSRVGMRDVFYLDSLGKRFGCFSKATKNGVLRVSDDPLHSVTC